MNGYERPALPVKVYLDETGTPIDYGSRWRGGSPPEDAYSRTSDLDRFEPLHTVARALIDWLIATFDVTVDRDESVVADMVWAVKEINGAVRLTPRDALAAPLTFVFTSFPGVVLHAGALFDMHIPVCGCEACDDDVMQLLDQLEWATRVVVGGGYSERVGEDSGGFHEYKLENDAGTQSGRSPLAELPADLAVERVDAARGILPASGTWGAWPLREGQR